MQTQMQIIYFAHLQATERVPYETLLKVRRSSSLVPPTEPGVRPSLWSAIESQSNPSGRREILNPRSLQNSPHKPALPHARAAHAEEEDWPDLTQLKWEGGTTGVVRVQQFAPADFRELRQKPTKVPYPAQDAHGQVWTKTRNGRAADQDQTLPWPVSLAKRSRSESPKALPSAPQGRAVACSTSRARQQQQQLESQASSRPNMTQPLRTHISLESLVVSPKLAGADQTQLLCTPEEASLAQAIIQDEPGHQQLSQHDFVAAAWRQDDKMSQLKSSHQASSGRSGRMISRGADKGASRSADRGGSRGASSQQASPQQPALHEMRLDSIKHGNDKEDKAAATPSQALPNFASPTRSSEAKAQHAQRSLHASPFRRSSSRQSAGSHNIEADTHQLLRKHSEGFHQAMPRGGVSADEGRNPGNGGETPSDGQRPPGDAAPLTSTFR